ncbi:MAG TPA: AsmA family protein, partial [Verrucomicrobiae bacterium]|nr:AsmA family protein [Verrucomicrobiae bacterium]
RVRHSLMDIIRGNIKVAEVTAVSPVIQIVEQPDGTSNLDPILKQQQTQTPPQKPQPPNGKPSERKPSSPPQVDIGQVRIENATLRKTTLHNGSAPDVMEVSDLNFALANVKNGGSGSMDLRARLAGQLNGAFESNLKFALTDDLKPAGLNGNTKLAGFSMIQSNRSTPKVDVDVNVNATMDKATGAAVLQKFQIAGTQNEKPLVTVALAQPMSIAMGNASGALPDSTLNAKVTGFNFKDWTALLGDDVPEGTLNADMEVQSREAGKVLALKGKADVGGLMLNDPEKRKLMKPLEAKLRIDGAMREKVLELAQLAVALTPTQLAKNDANLKGRIDLTHSDAITGKLELQSDALDLNGYYDLFAGEKKNEKPKPVEKPATKPGPSLPPASSPATRKKDLPFKDLVVDTRVGNVYLRELHLTNVVTGIRAEGSRVDLKPIAMSLNGAPVEGAISVDLGAKDLGYDVALKMAGVPLAPIANSFLEEYRNRAKGDLNANLQIKGVGTTGTSLKKTLQGQITASCTNGQIQLAGKKMREIIDDIAMYFGLPELRTAPLTAFDSAIGLGEGKIQIKSLDLISDAFTAHTEGAIAIANVLSNSPIPKLPITFALSRPLAERVNMAGNSPADARYVSLPQFLFVTGTFGKPKTAIDKTAIAGLAARKILPKEAGAALDALLGGAKGSSTNAPSTNKPSNPLDLLRKKLPK